MHRRLLLASAFAVAIAAPAQAQTEISWWHAMTGANNEVVEKLAKEFNDSQSDYKIMPVFKGTYPETLNAGIAAFRAKQPPAIIQVFDVGTGVMMGAEGAVKPVADVLTSAGKTFDKSEIPAGHRRLLFQARRHHAVVPLQLLLADPLLQQGHLREGRPRRRTSRPRPGRRSVRGRQARSRTCGAAPCGYTSTWLTWIHLENFAAWNNVPYGTQGERPWPAPTSKLEINAPIFVEAFPGDRRPRQGRRVPLWRPHLRGQAALPRPANAASSPKSSGGLGDIVKSGMNYGIGQLPYDADAKGAPQNTIPGGASLWVFGGKSDEEYKGVGGFFNYLSQTDVQERLHQNSGYLPVTMAAYEATKKSGFYDKNPGRETPITQMMGKEPTANSKGVRLPNLPQIRDIENEEFETMLAGKQTAQQALDNACRARQRAPSSEAHRGQCTCRPAAPRSVAGGRSVSRR